MDTISSIKNISRNDIEFFIKQNKDKTINNTKFSFLGKGGEGCVYRLGSLSIVMKIYKKKSHRNKEIYILKKLNLLMDKNICNNFLKTYTDLNMFGHPILFMDLINGNLENWVEIYHNHNEWICMIFQILFGLLILQNKLKMCHSDMKPKNILFKKIEKTTTKVSINNNHISTYESEYIFMISDFGHSQSLYLNDNNMQKHDIDLCIENNVDLKQLSAFHKRLAVSIITKHYTLDDILNIGKNNKQFLDYVEWIKADIEKDMKDYNPKVKHHMLVRDLSYYLLEKEYLDINNLPKLNTSELNIVLPSQEIIKVLESLGNLKGTDSLLNKLTELGKIINVDSQADKNFNLILN